MGSQMRWLEDLVRMTQENPRHAGETVSSQLAWKCLGIPLGELEEAAGKGKIWASLLGLLPPQPHPEMWLRIDR